MRLVFCPKAHEQMVAVAIDLSLGPTPRDYPWAGGNEEVRKIRLAGNDGETEMK